MPQSPTCHGDAQPRAGLNRPQLRGEECRFQPEVDEAGAGDLRRLAHVVDPQGVDDGLGKLTWFPPRLPPQAHRHVRLPVTVGRVAGRLNLRVHAGTDIAERGREGL